MPVEEKNDRVLLCDGKPVKIEHDVSFLSGLNTSEAVEALKSLSITINATVQGIKSFSKLLGIDEQRRNKKLTNRVKHLAKYARKKRDRKKNIKRALSYELF